MESPLYETDFPTFIYFLRNPADVGDEFIKISKDAADLIFNLLYSADGLPDSITNNADQFINDDIPHSIVAVLDLTDVSGDFQQNLKDYILNTFILIIWGINKYNKILFSLLFDIFDRSKPFYQVSQNQFHYHFDEKSYDELLENFQGNGGKDAISESIKFENAENDNKNEALNLSILQKTEWFQLCFKFAKITRDYKILSLIDTFSDFLSKNGRQYTKFNDFEMIRTCFKELKEYLYQLPNSYNETDFHVNKFFDFAYGFLEPSLNSRRFTVAIDIFNCILYSFHNYSINNFYNYAHKRFLIHKILSNKLKNTALKDIVEIACAFTENNGETEFFDSSDVYDMYSTSISSGSFQTIKDIFTRLLTFCKNEIVDDLVDKLLDDYYSDDNAELFEIVICNTKTTRNEEIIDYFLEYSENTVIQNLLKKISENFLDDDKKQLFIDSYFEKYQDDPKNKDLANIFPIMMKFYTGDIVHKMISYIDTNRKIVLNELKDYISTSDNLITKEDLLKLSKIVDDDLFEFLYCMLKKRKFSLIENDAIPIIDQLAHGSQHPSLDDVDKNDEEEFNISEKQLTLPFIQFLKVYLNQKQKTDETKNIVLFKGYKEIFNLFLIAKDKEIEKILMNIIIKLSKYTKTDYNSIQALSTLIKESIGINDIEDNDNKIDINTVNSDLKIDIADDKYCKIVELVKEYINDNEKSCFPDLCCFNGAERHEHSEKTINISIHGCGIDQNFIFPEYVKINDVHSFLENYFEPDSNFSLIPIKNSYSYGFTSDDTELEICPNSDCKLKNPLPIPLSIKLDESHFQHILYKQLSSATKDVRDISFQLLKLLPDDANISILNKEETSFIRKNSDNDDKNDKDFNVKNIIDRLRNTRFSQLQLEYQLEILQKYINLSKSFKNQLRENNIIDVLLTLLDENPTNELLIDLIMDIKVKQMNENIFHSLLTIFEANKNDISIKFKINSIIKKSIEKDGEAFTKAFNTEKNINYVDNLLSLNDNYLYNLVKKSIIPSLTDLIPLFNIFMQNLNKVYENPSYKKIFLKLIPLVRDKIDYNSDVQNKIIPEQKKYPNSSVTIELISAFKPTENLSTIFNSIDKLLSDTSDEEMQKAIFELISSYRSIEVEEKLIPYFSINIDRWNYDITHEHKSETGFCGLRNLGATCYFNSILQILFFTKPFCQLVLQQEESNIEFRKIFSSLVLSRQKSVDTSALIAVWKGWGSQPINPREQQDANEFFQMFIDKLPSDFKEYFQGKFVNTYKGINLTEREMQKSGTNENYEEFFSIQLVIKDFKNLSESFDHFISPDILSAENQYYMESLRKKVDAEKITRIEKVPPFLAIQLKRFEYNFETHIREKIMTSYEFESTICINRLMKDYGKTEENYFYSLYGIVLHSGTVDTGHYTALIKAGDKWFLFNDNEVEFYCEANSFDTKLSTEFFRNVEQYEPTPYILFYQRVEVPQTENPPQSATKENDKKYGDHILKDLIPCVCDEDKHEIEEVNKNFARTQWLFSHDCFDFILDSVSNKLKLTYFLKILGHSKNFNKFHSKFFNSFDENKKEFDNNWFLDFLIKNIDELQEILIHVESFKSYNSFVREKLLQLPINVIFPYYHSFALNMTKMTQLWRKVASFTSPMRDFISISDEAKTKAGENNWIHLSTNFIEDFYNINTNRVPIEGIDFSNLFFVMQSIIQNENKIDKYENDMNILKIRFNLILQSKDHLDDFYKLIIYTFPLIIDSPENFVLICEDKKQRYNFFDKIFENGKFFDIYEKYLNNALLRIKENLKNENKSNIDEKPDKNDFLLILIQYLIDKVNGEYEETSDNDNTYFDYQTRTFNVVKEVHHNKELVQTLIDKFDQYILPIVFAYPYNAYIGKLISDMFDDVKPKSKLIQYYNKISDFRSSSKSYDYKGSDAEMTQLLEKMIIYLKNEIEEEKIELNSNKGSEKNGENKENDNNKSALNLKTFFLLSDWIIKRNDLFNDKHFLDELMNIKDMIKEFSFKERKILYFLLIKFKYELTNGQHIIDVLSDIGYYNEDGKVNEQKDDKLAKFNEKIFIQILIKTDSLFNEDQIVEIYGSGWFINWLSKEWYNSSAGTQSPYRTSITKIVEIIANRSKESLELIIQFLNEFSENGQIITILLNIYLEKTYNFLPFDTINNLVNFAINIFSGKGAESGPVKKGRFLSLIIKLLNRVDELDKEKSDGGKYEFTIRLNNMKSRINSILKLINKANFSRYIVNFLSLLIPRLNEDMRNTFIEALVKYIDPNILVILANVGEFDKLNEIIINMQTIDDEYEKLFSIIADQAFKKEIAEKQNGETDNKFDINVEELLVLLFYSADKIDEEAIAPLLKKKQMPSTNEEISLIKNIDGIIDSLVERCNTHDLEDTLKIIVEIIDNYPKTKPIFSSKLKDKREDIKFYKYYYQIFSNDNNNEEKKKDEDEQLN